VKVKRVLSWLGRRFSVSFRQLLVGQAGVLLRLRYKGAAPFWRGWWIVEISPQTTRTETVLKLEITGGDPASQIVEASLALPTLRGAKRVIFAPWWVSQIRLKSGPNPQSVTLAEVKLSPRTEPWALQHMYQRIGATASATGAGRSGSLRQKIAAEAHAAGLGVPQMAYRYYDDIAANPSSLHARAYAHWIDLIEPCLFSSEQPSMPHPPKFSVILPVHNAQEEHLRRAIQSVLEQTYVNWELCIADDASTAAHAKPLIEDFCASDERIKAVFCSAHGHISKATNAGLALATGEFVTFLDHDDELSVHALNEVALALEQNPNLEIVYTDEDLIDEQGKRFLPHFKSDWNPYLLYSHNYVTHLCVYRHRLLEKAGGMREGLEGAQDYDLLLRCSRHVEASKIGHIPKVLYHWRMAATSTASGASKKTYTHEAGHRALQDYFASQGLNVEIKPAGAKNFYRVNFESTNAEPLVTIIVPTKDKVGLLRQCLDSLYAKTTYRHFEVLVVDNQSAKTETKTYLAEIAGRPDLRVLAFDEPFNYARICNFGAARAAGALLALVNNDVEVISPGWLDEMVMLASRPEVGCVGAKLYYEDDTIQHAGVIIGLGGYAAHSHRGVPRESAGYFNRLRVRQNLSAVTGACLVVSKAIYQKVEGMDEQLAVTYNDVDFCLRVLDAGYLNVFTPFAELYHFESKTRGYEETPESQARFQREKDYLAGKWGDRIRLDPYYNPNLTHSSEDFSLDL
jgi:GT2 family glycosyltransferase